jgi:N-acetyl sugar amidotransferase
LRFDEEEICAACRYFEERSRIDWDERRLALEAIAKAHRNRSAGNWDCIVPVSGGKDSTFQVLTVLELDLRPLCVVATTCDLSDLGRRNIENIKALGVDLVEVSPDPIIRRRLNRYGLEAVGDISWPEHVGIFTIPIRMATSLGISLLVWGENSQNEYGGPNEAASSPFLNRRWLEEFGGLLGLRVSDLPLLSDVTDRDLIPYQYPSDEQLETAQVKGIFLGHYVPWDGLTNALVSIAHGFSTFDRAVEISGYTYENLDNYQTGIHDYFKYLKFGFGRSSDISSLHVRRGRLTRDQAVKIVNRYDGNFPWTYLGKSLEEIIAPLGLTVSEFTSICDRFTNREIFLTDSDGNFVKNDQGNLTKRFELV